MLYFAKARKFVGYLVGVKPKNAKLDTSTGEGHAEVKLVLELTFDVPLMTEGSVAVVQLSREA